MVQILGDNTFVGCVDDTYALLQHKTGLYLTHIPNISKYLFYERALIDFSSMESFAVSPPAPITPLLRMALEKEGGGDMGEECDSIAEKLTKLLLSKSAMLNEYFSIDITGNGELRSLPEIIENYVPPMGALPSFLLKLSLDVNWYEEKPCFRGICDELAAFYKIQPKMYIDHSTTTTTSRGDNVSLKWIIQHTILPAFRTDFHPPNVLQKENCVVKVAALEKLYRIFERC
mmetsp:Transcript_1473/g.2154  ORF Transcript_1473/g.2154 Transcript_1473/m.2154 type:complete len:231 (-) Transcript_1473:100-792(-)